MVSLSGVQVDSGPEVALGESGPVVDVRRKESLRIFDWMDNEG